MNILKILMIGAHFNDCDFRSSEYGAPLTLEEEKNYSRFNNNNEN